jgi:hypothetical protein
MDLLDSGNTFNHQVLSGDRTRLVKAADIHATSERDAEWLGAEDGKLAEGDQRGVDRERQLHGKLWRDDRGENEDDIEQKLALG